MACVMFGGTEVESEADARSLSELPELADEDVEVGDFIELPPCLPDHYLAEIQRQKGWPCPRPGLAMDPDNEVPLQLMQLSLTEHTRHLVEGTLRDLVPPGERAVVRRRVAAALQSPEVVRRLYPPREGDKE